MHFLGISLLNLIVLVKLLFVVSLLGQNDQINGNFPKKMIEKYQRFKSNFIRAPLHRIVPGTLWCGDGSLTNNTEELGKFKSIDRCCRDHDLCDENIPAGGTLHGLTNDGDFTRSACTCDYQFYGCLKKIGSLKSLKIGKKYFNKLSPQCFVNDYPPISCNQTTWSDKHKKCVVYNRNTSAFKVWQWNDNLVF